MTMEEMHDILLDTAAGICGLLNYAPRKFSKMTMKTIREDKLPSLPQGYEMQCWASYAAPMVVVDFVDVSNGGERLLSACISKESGEWAFDIIENIWEV